MDEHAMTTDATDESTDEDGGWGAWGEDDEVLDVDFDRDEWGWSDPTGPGGPPR